VLGGKVFAYLPATHHIQTRCVSYRKKPAAQTAHLVFADTKANAEKPKELFFANA
jgi:hypothetical protein